MMLSVQAWNSRFGIHFSISSPTAHFQAQGPSGIMQCIDLHFDDLRSRRMPAYFHQGGHGPNSLSANSLIHSKVS